MEKSKRTEPKRRTCILCKRKRLLAYMAKAGKIPGIERYYWTCRDLKECKKFTVARINKKLKK